MVTSTAFPPGQMVFARIDWGGSFHQLRLVGANGEVFGLIRLAPLPRSMSGQGPLGPCRCGSMTEAGGAAVKSNIGGWDQSATALKSIWQPGMKVASGNLTTAPRNYSARSKLTSPLKHFAAWNQMSLPEKTARTKLALAPRNFVA